VGDGLGPQELEGAGVILTEKVYTHFHLCCGSGSGAAGFNDATAVMGKLFGKFECLGGIDVDPAACIDFEQMTGTKATLLDLMDEQQYRDFHGCAPPRHDWRPATPDDIWLAQGCRTPDVVFMSCPCKGFSGLLSEAASKGAKYQALNGLSLRGLWLLLEANKSDPIKIILFENVPRISTRGRYFLDQIIALLRAFGYAVQETEHDCGEIGNLGQSRKRYLLVARFIAKVPCFLYEPVKYPLRGVGEVLDKLPIPLSGFGGPLHRMPALQWKTWMRLALVEAGSDWRSLNKLVVEDGVLRDFGIIPEYGINSVLGVTPWEKPAHTVKGRSLPTNGTHAVADPRAHNQWAASVLGVNQWEDTGATVTGRMAPGGGAHAVADPRVERQARRTTFGVAGWHDTSDSIRGESMPSNGTFAVQDPRVNGHHKSVQLGVRKWEQAAGVITGKMIAGGGPHSVADPRLDGVRYNHVYRVVRYCETSPAVTGPGGAGGLAVADVRLPNWHPGASSSKLRVTPWEGEAARPITGSQQVGSGAGAIQDPRPVFARDGREQYLSAGHYGVVRYERHSRAITGSGQHDNGFNSVADPRIPDEAVSDQALPAPNEKVVCIIRAIDGTWHRPFTTLECGALQSMFDPEKYFASPEVYWDLHGMSDSAKRDRIGQAVPRASSKGMAETILRCLLAADNGETFTLSSEPIWVQPVVLALMAAR
jgi:site-specific DNA-cytosine methylase